MPPALVVSLLLAAPGQLENARALIDDLEFTGAIREIERVLPELALPAQLEAYAMLAVAWSAKSDVEQTKRAYLRLLCLDPAHTTDASLPPKLRTAFEAAAREVRAHPPVLLDLRTRAETDGVRVTGRIADPFGMVTTLRVGSLTTALADGAFEALVPRTGEIIVSAHAATGYELLRSVEPVLGSPLAVDTPASDPLLPWWGWTILGAAVVAGTSVGIYFAVRPDDRVIVLPPPEGRHE